MTNMNFKEFKMYADIKHSKKLVVDVREQLADLIYKQSRGVVAHNLAFRILNAEGDIEMNSAENDVITSVLNLCTPQFQDSFNHNVDNNE